MTFRHITAALALAGLLGAPAVSAADPACRDASFCPDLQLVRPCQATSCDSADRNKAWAQREERIVEEGLDGPNSSHICSRLGFAKHLYVEAAADGDPSALLDRDRVQGKLKRHNCSSIYQ
jgi:hypothetical protein